MKRSLELFCSLLCGAALFAIMALTFFDVLGRKLANNSIPGSLELTELLMVVTIFSALPLVSLRGEHVVFDSLDAWLPDGARRFQGMLVHGLCAATLLALGWLMVRHGLSIAETGETTAQLRIPKAPFIHGMGALCALTGLVHLGLIARPQGEAGEGEGVAL